MIRDVNKANGWPDNKDKTFKEVIWTDETSLQRKTHRAPHVWEGISCTEIFMYDSVTSVTSESCKNALCHFAAQRSHNNYPEHPSRKAH